MTPLSILMSTMSCGERSVALTVPPDWMQGRSAFGGLQGAVVVAAMQRVVESGIPLRTLQMSFIAPVAGDGLRAEASILRAGGSAVQVEARIGADGATAAHAIGIFGRARTSAIARMPVKPDLGDAPKKPLRFVEGAVPSFIQHFDAVWRIGGTPFSGDPTPAYAVDLALKDAGPMTLAHLLAFADFVPPIALSMLDRPTPGSSLTWMLEILRDDIASLPLAGWRADSELVAAQDGYISQSTHLWAPDGKIAALSRQAMVIFG
jgi:acyl-coenzyme A thioesterase PaaI-like protein